MMIWFENEHSANEWLKTGKLPQNPVHADRDQAVADDFNIIRMSFEKFGSAYLDKIQIKIDKLR